MIDLKTAVSMEIAIGFKETHPARCIHARVHTHSRLEAYTQYFSFAFLGNYNWRIQVD